MLPVLDYVQGIAEELKATLPDINAKLKSKSKLELARLSKSWPRGITGFEIVKNPLDSNEDGYELTLATLFEGAYTDLLNDSAELTMEKLFEEKPPPPPSEAKKIWENLKATYPAKGEALDPVMEMDGIEEVKLGLIEIAFRIALAQVNEGIEPTTHKLGVNFTGNPGVPKSAVAHHYAQFLKDSGVYSNSTINCYFSGRFYPRDTSWDRLDSSRSYVNNIGQCGPCFDEVPEKWVVSLAAVTGGRDTGVPSTVCFPDFTENELYHAFVKEISNTFDGRVGFKGSWINGYPVKVLIQRIARDRGTPNFGNSNIIPNIISEILCRQNKRLLKESKIHNDVDSRILTQEDLIGPPPSKALEGHGAWKKLEAMVGLKSVKAAVKYLKLITPAILGKPGTGKTTVAKLYAQILADAGLLSSSEVLVKTPADFIGRWIGHSETKTKDILNQSKGKVLVIDEAYMLGNGGHRDQADSFRNAVIDVLVGNIDGNPNEDRCIILVGYRKQMEEMLRKMNPGLARRFPLESAFEFDDYTKEELREILELKLSQQSLRVTDEAKEVATEVLERARNSTLFGNAGEVDNLLSRAKERQVKRLVDIETHTPESIQTLEASDIDEDFDRADLAVADVKELFKGMIGNETLVEKLEGWQQIVKKVRALDLGDPTEYVPFTFLFRGPPGTGKTTTARKMGKIFYNLGFLATGDIVECSASDLIAEYVGQTGPKTRKVFEKALGKVLFIDEAYRLTSTGQSSSYVSEAVGEIVDILTQEKFHNKLVVVLAGYEEDINKLLATNPGLSSRFPETINFQSLTPAQCRDLLLESVNLKNVLETADIGSHVYDKIYEHFDRLISLPFWGSARDVLTLAKIIKSRVLMMDSVDDIVIIEEMDKMMEGRVNRAKQVK
ncbi:ATPases of the AAA+ class [Jackrogersella minutella]|nr:ATPases of the AAA+ class [Jackrogersella minutella]